MGDVMSGKYTEYNNSISLKNRDIAEIIDKASQDNCDYFMQLSLQGRGLWIGFKEPFESGIDKLYALYYKIRTRKGCFIYACLGLWRDKPSANQLYLALMGVNASVDAVINSDEMREFMHMGESSCLALRHPTYQSSFDGMIPSFVNY